MTDRILERAVARRDAALREAAEWEAFIARYQQLAGDRVETRQPGKDSLPRRRPIERELPPHSELAKTIAATEAVLNGYGHPLPLEQLFNEVTKSGLVVGGQKPKDNYSARLYNSGCFRSLGKKTGWWFKDRPLPGSQEDDHDTTSETPNSGTLFGAPKTNGSQPLSP